MKFRRLTAAASVVLAMLVAACARTPDPRGLAIIGYDEAHVALEAYERDDGVRWGDWLDGRYAQVCGGVVPEVQYLSTAFGDGTRTIVVLVVPEYFSDCGTALKDKLAFAKVRNSVNGVVVEPLADDDAFWPDNLGAQWFREFWAGRAP